MADHKPVEEMTKAEKQALADSWGIPSHHSSGRPIDVDVRLTMPKWQTKRKPEGSSKDG